jgi:hypothetical protein
MLGVLGLLRSRRVLPSLFLVAWLFYSINVAIDFAPEQSLKHHLIRFSLCFLAGAAVFDLSDHLASSRLLAMACGVILLGASFLPDYKVVAIAPLAYLAVWGGMKLPMHIPGRWDVSYGVYIYGFPVQQTLALWGVPQTYGFVPYLLASAALVGLLALISCVAVEQPALRLKRLGSGRPRAVTA